MVDGLAIFHTVAGTLSLRYGHVADAKLEKTSLSAELSL